MKTKLIGLITILLSSSLFAQYQKMEKASTINLSGFESYYHAEWSKQLSHRNNFTLGGFYFKDDNNVIKIENFVANLGLNHWLLKVSNLYLSAGGGAFFTSTRAESIADTKDKDISFGVETRAEVEYYLSWWLVLYGEVKQMKFFKSDYYNSKYVAGGGIKFVF